MEKLIQTNDDRQFTVVAILSTQLMHDLRFMIGSNVHNWGFADPLQSKLTV